MDRRMLAWYRLIEVGSSNTNIKSGGNMIPFDSSLDIFSREKIKLRKPAK